MGNVYSSSTDDISRGLLVDASNYRGRLIQGEDKRNFTAATEMEAADTWTTNIILNSSDRLTKVEFINGDLDTGCAPTLVIDLGLTALESHDTVTSGTTTRYAKGDVVSSDAIVDGSDEGQSANATWTEVAMKTDGADDANKQLWQILGYDDDPEQSYRLTVTFQAASSALGSAADFGIRTTARAVN